MADKVGYLGTFAKCLRIPVTLLRSRYLDFAIAVPLPHKISVTPSVFGKAENSLRNQCKDHQFDFVSGFNNVTPVRNICRKVGDIYFCA